MKALITGGAGFIGYHLTKELLENGYEIVLVDNFSRGVEDVFLKDLERNSMVTFFTADLMIEENINKLDRDFDFIYHFVHQ